MLQIDQVGLPAGIPGRARNDGLPTGAEVTLTDTEPGGTTLFELLWVPPADTTAVQSLDVTDDTHVWKFTPSAVTGPYRIRLTHTGAGTVRSEVRIFGVASESGLVPPAPGERSDPTASLLNATDPQIIDRCERNWATEHWPDGNPFGWGFEVLGGGPPVEQGPAERLATISEDDKTILVKVDPPTEVGQIFAIAALTPEIIAGWITPTVAESGPRGLVWSDGVVTTSFAAAAIGEITLVDPTAQPITIGLPAQAVHGDRVGVLQLAAGTVTVTVQEVGSLRDPSLDGEQFELVLNQANQYVELMLDGQVWRPLSYVKRPVRQLTGNLFLDPPDAPHAFDDEFDGGSPDLAERGFLVRSIEASPVTLTRIGDVDPLIWPTQIESNRYRSTIYGSVLMFQCGRGVTIYKQLPPGTQQARLAARIWPSSLDTNVNWNNMRNGMFMGAQLYYALPYVGQNVCVTVVHCNPDANYYRYRAILNGSSPVYNFEQSDIDRNTRGDLLMVESRLTPQANHSHAVVDANAQRVMRQTPVFSNGVPGATQIAAAGCEVTYGGEAPNTNFATRHWTNIDYIRFRPYGTFFPR